MNYRAEMKLRPTITLLNYNLQFDLKVITVIPHTFWALVLSAVCKYEQKCKCFTTVIGLNADE